MSGLFITFEGCDGSGKSTQIARLERRLRTLGYDVRSFREPGGPEVGGVGERIRAILLDPALGELDPGAELLLYEAARAQLVSTHYRPALADGAIVLGDRYTDSTIAYQGYGRRALPLERIRALNELATGGLVPDLTILLDVDAADGLAQATTRGADRLERAGRAFHERVRSGFLALAAAEPERVKLVPRGTVDEVAGAVWALVEPLLPATEGGA